MKTFVIVFEKKKRFLIVVNSKNIYESISIILFEKSFSYVLRSRIT